MAGRAQPARPRMQAGDDSGAEPLARAAPAWMSPETPPSAVATSNDEILDLDRQLAEPYTGRMVDGVRDGRRHARQPDLADAARSQLVQVRVGEFHKMDFQRGPVGVCRDDVVGEIGIDRCAVARIV